ncbi:MAG: hypothetical protein JXR86_03905, partial [Spirochaetales bacterium]|nr:hypothetical protein [Spirochaetales bacterium]
MAANKPKNFEEAEKELEQYGSWVKGSPEDLETDNLDIDFAIDGDPENALMTEEEEMLLGELESSETESSFGDISFDEFGDLDDEEDDTFGMELPDDDFTGGQAKNPDLSMKILQSIENELVGLRNEVKDLKKELSQIQKSPESSMSFPPEAEAQSTGFFDEDDDETIALTGDELDNILESASVEVEPDLDDIISTGEGDEIPEEFNESNILDEDEFQDTEDLIGNTELDDSLLDDLSLGEDDPALAELTEIDDDFMSEELIINNDIPEDFDLDDIPDMDDSGESFEIDGESFSVEEFEGSDGDSFTVEEYSADENSPSLSEMSGNEELVESYISENRIEESFIIEEDEDGVFDEGEEIDIAVEEELDGGSFSESEKSVPFEDLEDIDLSSFDDNLVEESSDGDFEQIDVNSFLDEENEITVDIGPDNEIAFDEISIDEEALEPGPDLTEEVGISFDEELPEEDTEFSLDEIEIEEDSDDFGSEDLTLDEISLEEELPEEDTEFSLGEIEIEEDSDDFGSEDLTLDEISLDDELLEEDTEFSLDEIEIEDDSDDFGSEDLTLDEISLEEEEPEEDTEFSLDEIEIEEDSDDFGSEDLTLDEISLEEELPEEDTEFSLDEIEIEEDSDDFGSEDLTLDEISLEEEEPEDDT